MKVVYIIGPYRAESEWEVVKNIRRAEEVAMEVWRLGAVAICPHKNTALFGGALPDQRWLEGDLELLRRSDAVVVLPGSEESHGARQELKMAMAWGKPIHHIQGHISVDRLIKFLEKVVEVW